MHTGLLLKLLLQLFELINDKNEVPYLIWLPVKLQDQVEIVDYSDHPQTTLWNMRHGDPLDWVYNDWKKKTGKEGIRKKQATQYPLGPILSSFYKM
jgi:hypothetical protein